MSTLQECFSLCIHHPSCQSVNYKEDALGNCELNDHLKENVLERYFKAMPGWTYFATDYTEKNVSLHFSNPVLCEVGITFRQSKQK